MKLKGIVFFVLSMALLFVLGYSWRDVQSGRLPSADTLVSLIGVGGDGRSMAPPQLFEQTYEKILADYYKPVEPKDLRYAGMGGLLASLGDPHTMFLEPRIAKEFNLETTANFTGVGARLSPDPLGARVATVFEEGPADNAGLKAGDIVTGVNGKSVSGKSIDAIVSQIRGKAGTYVTLEVLRGEDAKPITLRIKRAEIITPTVEAKMLPNSKVGHIYISAFAQPTTDQFDSALNRLERQGMQALIIDVRGNPGGLLKTSVDMLSRFVEDKVVVKMKGRDGREEVAESLTGYKRDFNYPIAVLINEESASAAEIFAGVLRDYRVATLIGEHSYGKASVQNVRPLVDGSSAKITIARYFLPSGEDISRKVDEYGQYVSGGIHPEITATQPPEQQFVFGELEKDAALKKAVETVKGRIGQ